MISFVGKHIETKEVIRTPGKRITAKVVWKKDKFQVRIEKDLYDIEGWDDLSECTCIYALPTNTFFTPWHRKLYTHKSDSSETIQTTLRYWGRFRHGMTVYGKLIDNVFYPSKVNKNESIISGVIK